MDVLENYLNNLFASLPQTEEVKRAKENLAQMMEDKYNELIAEGKKENEAVGIVIAEFGDIDEIKKEFGIHDEERTEDNRRHVSATEAKEYIQVMAQSMKRISVGVVLCIWAPIVLLVLSGLQEGKYQISDAVVGGVGITVLFVLVAIATAIFIYNGVRTEKYEYLKREPFVLDHGFELELRAQEEEIKLKSTTRLIIGVILCIVAAVPTIIAGVITDDTSYEYITILAVAGLLFIVSIGVYLLIGSGSKMDCYKVLLQEADYCQTKKEGNKIMDTISSIYWSVAVIAYLAWSFITNDWAHSWIIWPIAGVSFGLISAIVSAATAGERKDECKMR